MAKSPVMKRAEADLLTIAKMGALAYSAYALVRVANEMAKDLPIRSRH